MIGNDIPGCLWGGVDPPLVQLPYAMVDSPPAQKRVAAAAMGGGRPRLIHLRQLLRRWDVVALG